MKKDGIQTRNRKLSAKSKKKRGSMVDFFAPFDSKSFSAYGATSSYLSNPMSQYYGTPASMAASQFMAAASNNTAASMASMYSNSHILQQQNSPNNYNPTNSPLSPSIIGAMT